MALGGVSGGAAVPPLLGATADWRNSTPFAFVVPVCFFIAAWTYPLCVNFIDYYRIPADAIGNSPVGLQGEGGRDEEGRRSEAEKEGVVQVEQGGPAEAERVGKE
jgi:FHS family L-fucose permease-like MFS transporter